MAEYRVIDRTTFPRERPEPSAPTVNLSASTGVVYISKRACELLELESGDRVEILQDAASPATIGFRKTDSENGFKVHPKKVGMCFAAAGLVRRMLTIFGRSVNTTIQLGTEMRSGAYWIIPRSIR